MNKLIILFGLLICGAVLAHETGYPDGQTSMEPSQDEPAELTPENLARLYDEMKDDVLFGCIKETE